MAFCKACGSRQDDGTKFCGNCGAPIEQETAGASQQSQQNNQTYTFTDTTNTYDRADIEQNKVVCAISYISVLFFLPLVSCPNSRFGKFHANQALILLIASAAIGTVGSICNGVVEVIPFLPDFIRGISTALIGLITSVGPLAGMVFGIVNAAEGKAKELPLIGKFRLIK